MIALSICNKIVWLHTLPKMHIIPLVCYWIAGPRWSAVNCTLVKKGCWSASCCWWREGGWAVTGWWSTMALCGGSIRRAYSWNFGICIAVCGCGREFVFILKFSTCPEDEASLQQLFCYCESCFLTWPVSIGCAVCVMLHYLILHRLLYLNK